MKAGPRLAQNSIRFFWIFLQIARKRRRAEGRARVGEFRGHRKIAAKKSTNTSREKKEEKLILFERLSVRIIEWDDDRPETWRFNIQSSIRSENPCFAFLARKTGGELSSDQKIEICWL